MSELTLIRLMLIGDSETGKTNLCERYVTNTFTPCHGKHGIDLRIVYRIIDGTKVKVQLWDVPSDRCDLWLSSICSDIDAFMVVYDLTDPQTLINAKDWLENCQHFRRDTTQLNLVGNKADGKINVPSAFRDTVAIVVKANLFDVSAKTGDGVDAMFEAIIRQAFHKRYVETVVPLKLSRRCVML